MKKSILLFVLLVFGCQNLYRNYYTQSRSFDPENTIFFTEKPKIFYSNNPKEDLESYHRKGYVIIGTSTFNGGDIGKPDSKLIKVSKEVGAEIVLWNQVYTNTVNGTASYNYYTPTTQTSRYSGNISNDYTPQSSYNYSGSMTTYGQQQNTAHIPYSIRRYDYSAAFLGKVKNTRFGFRARNLSSEERAQNHLNSGVYIVMITEDTPASNSDLAEGDIVIKIDKKNIKNFEQFSAIDVSKFVEIKIEFLREGKKKITTLNFNRK